MVTWSPDHVWTWSEWSDLKCVLTGLGVVDLYLKLSTFSGLYLSHFPTCLFLGFCLPSGLQQVKHIIELGSCDRLGMLCSGWTDLGCFVCMLSIIILLHCAKIRALVYTGPDVCTHYECKQPQIKAVSQHINTGVIVSFQIKRAERQSQHHQNTSVSWNCSVMQNKQTFYCREANQKTVHLAHIYCTTTCVNAVAALFHLCCRAHLPTERLLLPAFSFPPSPSDAVKAAQNFYFWIQQLSWPFHFHSMRPSALLCPIHPVPSSSSSSLSLSTILLLPACSASLSHFLEAHLKSLIVRLSLCSTQGIINSTGAASRGFSLLC